MSGRLVFKKFAGGCSTQPLLKLKLYKLLKLNYIQNKGNKYSKLIILIISLHFTIIYALEATDTRVWQRSIKTFEKISWLNGI